MPLILIAASLGAAIIHFAHGPEHIEELGALGLGFYVSGALQVGWALLALAANRSAARSWLARAAFPTGVALNVAIILAWVVSRTVGLPAGEQPWTPEPVGLADGICALLEAGVVVGLLAWHRNSLRPALGGQRTFISMVTPLAMVSLIAMATFTASNAHEAHGGMEDVDGPMGAVHMQMQAP
jgi:hypothetical protein